MCKWKSLKLMYNVGEVESKCVAEFNLSGRKNIPWERFKIKIFEKNNGNFYGYTNLQVYVDEDYAESGFGMGKTIEDTLIDTINDFFSKIHDGDNPLINNFEKKDPYDF